MSKRLYLTTDEETPFTTDVIKYLSDLIMKEDLDIGYRIVHQLMLTSKSNFKLIYPDFSLNVERLICSECKKIQYDTHLITCHICQIRACKPCTKLGEGWAFCMFCTWKDYCYDCVIKERDPTTWDLECDDCIKNGYY